MDTVSDVHIGDEVTRGGSRSREVARGGGGGGRREGSHPWREESSALSITSGQE